MVVEKRKKKRLCLGLNSTSSQGGEVTKGWGNKAASTGNVTVLPVLYFSLPKTSRWVQVLNRGWYGESAGGGVLSPKMGGSSRENSAKLRSSNGGVGPDPSRTIFDPVFTGCKSALREKQDWRSPPPN